MQQSNENIVVTTLLRAAAIVLFAVGTAWAGWVTNAVHTTSLRQERIEAKMDNIEFKLDLLIKKAGIYDSVIDEHARQMKDVR
jgi:hypothetical protein